MPQATNNNADYWYSEMLNVMRNQGRKDNPTTIQLGIMQSSNSVKVGDLILNAEDLYIADYLINEHTRKIKTPYVANISIDVQSGIYDVKNVTADVTKQDTITYADGLKKGDIVAVQKLYNTNMYVILLRVVKAE